MIKTLKHLYELGITPLWLQAKSKRPVESNWTEAPRPKLSTLIADYKTGYNLGVRLGVISRVGDGFLSAIDIDIKSSDKKHRREAYEKVHSLMSEVDIKSAPLTQSGRGHGSAHVWIKTETPVSGRRLFQSTEKVEVHMPTTKASKHDVEVLGDEKIKAGTRLRPAWEVALMGQGQQIVVPPSIHPDTNKSYVWKRELKDVFQVPLVDPSKWGAERPPKSEETKVKDKLAKDFINAQGAFEVVVDYDLESDKRVGQETKDLIAGDADCADRSVGLFEAARGLVQAGLTRNEIITVLSEPGTFLGDACYEHAKTSDRFRAARWLGKYTVDKCIAEFSAQLDFDSEVEVTEVLLDAKAAEAQERELLQMTGWQMHLERTSTTPGAKPKGSLKNVLLVLENASEDGNIFKYDAFRDKLMFAKVPPWGDAEVNAMVSDADVVRIRRFLSHQYGFEPAKDIVYEAITLIAHDNSFNPVTGYLNSLEWDGVPRIGTWLKDYLGATEEEPYLSAVSRKFLTALVARAYEPGCKFDHILVLEGKQGLGKSTVLANLVGQDLFSDTEINIGDKDAVVNLMGVWLYEFAEMSAIKKQEDVNLLKKFITTRVDRIRLPYGRLAQDFPRRSVFVGSTNMDEYLKDKTGNRRFWPVNVTKADAEGVLKVRDQLFAEAVLEYHMGEKLYLDSNELIEQANSAQEDRLEQDPMLEALTEWVAKNGGINEIAAHETGEINGFPFHEFRISWLFSNGTDFDTKPPLAGWKGAKWELMEAAACLKKLGFGKGRPFRDGSKAWMWSPKKQKWPNWRW